MAVVRKKQDDRNLKTLRELVTSGGGNRQCFDCGQKGPTYVNMTIGSFVCTRCSGVLRGLTPPHRVKSISMATFTPEEIEFLKSHGNDVCAKTWLGLWDPKRVIHQDQRELMIDKYERKRYYLEPASPLKSLTNATSKLSSNISNGSSSSNASINSSSSFSNNQINQNNSHTNSNNNAATNGILGGNGISIGNNMLGNTGIGSGGGSGGGGGLGNVGVNNLNSNRNGQINRFNFQNQFTSNENGFYESNNINNNNANNILMNGFNGIGNSTINNNQMMSKNSLNMITSTVIADTANAIAKNSDNKSHHGFTPDSDFVADFGSANIFNATTTTTAAVANPLNGFKLQPPQSHSKNNGISNGNACKTKSIVATNGGLPSNGFTVNGSNTNHSDVINANENFADFDHAPIIYNAAAYQTNNNNNNSNNISSNNNKMNNNYDNNNYYNTKNNNYFLTTTNSNNNNLNQTVPTSFSSSLFSTNFNSNNYNNVVNGNNNIYNNNNNNNNNNNISNNNNCNYGNNNTNNNNTNHYANINSMQWNLWHQYQSQWPLSSSSSSMASFTSLSPSNEQNNRWSLPMSNSASNSMSLSSLSSATFNSNSSSINSTPPADRYAALKDLDEQLRERKAAAAIETPFSSVQVQSQSNVNPFKMTAQPPTQQSQQIINPFQTTFNQSTTTTAANSIFGTPSSSSSSSLSSQQQQQQMIVGNNGGGGGNVTANVFNNTSSGSSATASVTVFGTQPTVSGFNNGFLTQPTMLATNNLNGCTLHYGTTQQIPAAGNSITTTNLKNPFATSSLNSNNPFL